MRACTPCIGRPLAYVGWRSMSKRLPTTQAGELPGGLNSWLSSHEGPWELVYRTGRQYEPVVDLRSETPLDVLDELPMHIDPLLNRLASNPPPRWPLVTLGVRPVNAKRQCFGWHTEAEAPSQAPGDDDDDAPELEDLAQPLGPLVVCSRCLRPTTMADPNLREMRLALRDVVGANVRLTLSAPMSSGPELVAQDDAHVAAEGMLMNVLGQALGHVASGTKKPTTPTQTAALDMRDNVLAVLGLARVGELEKLVPAIKDAMEASTEEEAKAAMGKLQEAVPLLMNALRPNEIGQLIPILTEA